MNWLFQKDAALPYRAKSTRAWHHVNCQSFIMQEDCRPSSPELNPLDYPFSLRDLRS